MNAGIDSIEKHNINVEKLKCGPVLLDFWLGNPTMKYRKSSGQNISRKIISFSADS